MDFASPQGQIFAGSTKQWKLLKSCRKLLGQNAKEFCTILIFPVEHHLSRQTSLPRGQNQPAARVSGEAGGFCDTDFSATVPKVSRTEETL